MNFLSIQINVDRPVDDNIEDAIVEWEKAKKLGKASKFLDKKIEDGKLYE